MVLLHVGRETRDIQIYNLSIFQYLIVVGVDTLDDVDTDDDVEGELDVEALGSKKVLNIKTPFYS